MTLYEESVSDQRARVTALYTIVGTLYSCHVFGAENRDTLVQASARAPWHCSCCVRGGACVACTR